MKATGDRRAANWCCWRHGCDATQRQHDTTEQEPPLQNRAQQGSFKQPGGRSRCARVTIAPSRQRSITRCFVLLLLTATSTTVDGFAISKESYPIMACSGRKVPGRRDAAVTAAGCKRKQLCFMTSADDNAEDAANTDDEMYGEDLDTGTVLLEDLSWRVEKLRLEEQNKKRFLKSSPRFLPYNECRRWVQAFGRWETEEDWRQWISMGEKRNAYIPSRPDEYYGKLGQWISWEHFLLIDPDKEEPEQKDG